MSSRRPAYVIGVVLLAILFSIPQIVLAGMVSYVVYRVSAGIGPSIPFFGEGKEWIYPPEHVPFWQNKFVNLDAKGGKRGPNAQITLVATDPETGEQSEFDITLANPRTQPVAFGPRLLVQQEPDDWCEVIDGQLHPMQFQLPLLGVPYPEYFLLNGELTCAVKVNDCFTVFSFTNDAWNEVGDVVLPRKLDDSKPLQRDDHLQFLNREERVHQFLYLSGRIYYRESLNLAPKPDDGDSAVTPKGSKDKIPEECATPRTDGDQSDSLEGWSLVCAFRLPLTPNYAPSSRLHWGILVGGKPAVLCIDGIDTRNAVGHLYRFDDTHWAESTSLTFPFGAVSFRAVTSTDCQRSYVVVTTSTGRMNVYAIEETGIRQTGLMMPGLKSEKEMVIFLGGIPMAMLAAGLLLGLATWSLMTWFSRPEYGFGAESAKLASLGWRGCARLIDLGLLVITTVGIGWLMTLGFDGQSFAEALNLKVDHPTVLIAQRVAVNLIAWFLVIALTMVVAQAIWGVTPGKWLCGLRTVRTSLRRCGFARSLAREIVFFVDCGHGLCWTPGIVSIAFTDKRQRLGDLVADTIVVESRSRGSSNEPGS